ncbi:MAG: hypothetical protein INH41_11790 [Myxococcaceae bacterium]|jgi:hypothetical protein|nr:hypothetical protein [Myxococcaceae bacterium]MCA3013065.1 hypothetical protein [Myxococcaceae bacterium]
METTVFLKPRFVIAALPGTGELRVQVNAERPASSAVAAPVKPRPH